MSYSKLSVLRKAGQLLHFQYDIENEISDTGKLLASYLQQAIDETLVEADWIHAIKLIELTYSANDNLSQYGFKYTFKLPNDCVRDVGIYPYYIDKGTSAFSPAFNMYIVGLPFGHSGLSGMQHGLSYRLHPLKFKRINNLIFTDINKILLEYISNDDAMLNNVNEIWFISLIAYKLAILAGYHYLNSTDLVALKNEYFKIILPNAKNKNCNLKDKIQSYSTPGVYPYTEGGQYY